MSLLIKALANAEKGKQEELNKVKADKSTVPYAPTLELMPIDTKDKITSSYRRAENIDKNFTSETANLGQISDEKVALEAESMINSIFTTSDMKDSHPLTKKTSTDKSIDQIHLTSSVKANKEKDPSLGLLSTGKQAVQDNQQAAAKVFVANQMAKKSSSKSMLFILAILGTLFILVALQGISYIHTLDASKPSTVKPSTSIQSLKSSGLISDELAGVSKSQKTLNEATAGLSSKEIEEMRGPNQNNAIKRNISKNNEVFDASTRHEKASIFKSSSVKRSLTISNASALRSDEDAPLKSTEKPAAIKLTSKTSLSAVDPTLLSAYRAFSQGDYSAAQQQYRQVLQQDARNVDALLGMAAIAQHQDRDADAAGWYQKVLEIEPRNIIALTATMTPQTNGDAFALENRIKGLLVQQPEAASLYAALGNLYAGQGQWLAAQGAYFDACRFDPLNADYLFNLAISLDHLGKSKLALKQYEHALDLVNKNGATSPDKVQLVARIQALQ